MAADVKKQKIIDTITDAIIKNTSTECPHCHTDLEVPGPGTEEEIYYALLRIGAIQPDGN